MSEKNDPMFISLVVPSCLSETDTQQCFDSVLAELATHTNIAYELIVVMDSADTEKNNSLKQGIGSNPNIIFIETDGPAVAAGWEAARGDVLAVLDGNISQQLTSLQQLIESLEQGSDFVIASQYQHETTNDDEPLMGCTAIRRESLSKIKDSEQWHKLLFDMLGEDNMQAISDHFDKGITKKITNKWKHFAESIHNLIP